MAHVSSGSDARFAEIRSLRLAAGSRGCHLRTVRSHSSGRLPGAESVAPYSLCVQFTQPVCGLAGSGLNFLFLISPAASAPSQRGVEKNAVQSRCYAISQSSHVCSAPLLIAGDRIIRIWAGAAVARSAAPILPLILLGSALTGLSVTGIYALQSLGLFRTVSFIVLGSRVAMLPVMIYMLHHLGLYGLAVSRACLGSVALLVYLPLGRRLTACAQNTASPIALSVRPSRGVEAMKILLSAASFSSTISGLPRHAFNLAHCLLPRPEVRRCIWSSRRGRLICCPKLA